MFKTFALLLTLIFFTSCSLLKSDKIADKTLVVNKDAKLIFATEEKEIKKDETIELPKDSFLVRTKGHIPVYVIPLKSSFKEVKVSLNQFESGELTDTFKNSINSTLSDSLFDIHEIQNEIFKKQYNRALSLIEKAEKKYGKISFLTYTKASVYYLRGDTNQAKELLRSVKDNGRSKEKIESFLREIE